MKCHKAKLLPALVQSSARMLRQGGQVLLLQQDAGGGAVPRELPAARAAWHGAAHRSDCPDT